MVGSYTGKVIHVPALLESWPWPAAINPLYEQVQEESTSWFRKFDLYRDRKKQAIHDHLDTAKFGASVCPKADYALLRLATDYLHLGFWIDYFFDTSPSDVIRQLTESIAHLLESGDPRLDSSSPQSHIACMEILRDFRKRIETFNPSQEDLRRFVKEYRGFLEAELTQAIDHENKVIRDIESYLSIRRSTIAIRPGIALLGLALGIPQEILDDPYTDTLTNACLDMVIIQNDAYSWNVEQVRKADGHNIITVLMKQRDIDVQEAYEHAAQLHRETQEHFLELHAKRPDWGNEGSIQAFFDGLGEFVRGVDEWSSMCLGEHALSVGAGFLK
ncbi:hypothetical protein CC1G_09421 [Coprinopsis cinerea okayama7|uniref:Terpene synthase n=1 Tax=Coprinopsis cinerea (strain Okayama-7 / 130 / ATCC MYA-4618 / FGSC 9003) TaxID=240176 RepID=A8NIJ1_COPC7|nr:hypothetical protein CC1G_09421 [Coprinopsis cinerea okayama7\|eukprot:XP_001834007.1 hypothetical protein CC1G_09421 [Coprinopsis cinerea okayama7\